MTDYTRTRIIENDPHQPAFPRSYVADGHNGMTLRDWFAGRLIGSLVTRDNTALKADVADAYRIADMMLAERENTSTLTSADRATVGGE